MWKKKLAFRQKDTQAFPLGTDMKFVKQQKGTTDR